MKLPRDLSGEELIRTLCREWGYDRAGQGHNLDQATRHTIWGWDQI